MLMVWVLILGVLVVAMIIGAMWGRAYERSLWQRHLLQRSGLLSDEPARLADALNVVRSSGADPERLAQAVDAIAVEVERIGEGQRFLTRLLAERESPRSTNATSPAPGSVRSPIPPTT